MNKYSKIGKNMFWFTVGSMGSKFVTFLMVPLYTAKLSQTEYGTTDVITTLVQLLFPILTLQIGDAIIKFSLGKKEKKEKILNNSLVIFFISILIACMLIPIINKVEILKPYSIYLVGILLLTELFNILKSYLQGIGKVHIFAAADILYTLIFVLSNIIFLLWLDKGVNGYLSSFLISLTISVIFISIKINLLSIISIKEVDKKLLISMIVFSVPLLPSTLNWIIMDMADRYLIILYMGISFSGLYTISYKLPTIITTINSIFYNSWRISAIEEYNNDDRNKFFTTMFNLNFLIIIFLTSIFLSMVKFVYSFWVDPSYFEAWNYAAVLILASTFQSLASFFGVGYLVSNKTKGAFRTSIIGSCINIIFNIILIPIWGLYGAAIATIFGYLSVCMYRIIETRKFFVIKYDIKMIIGSYVVIAIQFIVCIWRYNLFIQLIFTIILFIFNYSKIKELYLIKMIFNKINVKFKRRN